MEEIPADGPALRWVRVRLRAERLEWIPSLLAWLDRPFVIEYPDALRGHVHALARRLSASASDVPGTAGQPRPD